MINLFKSNYLLAGTTPETKSSSSGKTVIRHTNGWDYNLQSPFANRQKTPTSISPILSQRTATQTLTTFVPTTTLTPPSSDLVSSPAKSQLNGKQDASAKLKNNQLLMEAASSTTMTLEVPVIETVPITTMPTNGCAIVTCASPSSSNLPRHFFAPIKPKLKLNTALANQKRLPPPPPPPIANSNNDNSSKTVSLSTQPYSNGAMPQKTDPPDIYVTNALASPYRVPLKAPTSQPPAVPQRSSANSASAGQVSSPVHIKLQRQHNLHAKHLHHYQQHQQQQQHQLLEFAKCIRNVANNATNNDADVQRVASEQQQYTILCLTSANCATTTTTTSGFSCQTLPNNFMLLTTTTQTTSSAPAACNTTFSTNIALNLTPITSTRTTNILSLSLSCCSYAASSPCLLTTLDGHLSPASFKFVNSNVHVTKANEPVYAVAQNLCHNLITAPAVTQPVMSATVKYCSKQQFLMDTVKMLPVVDCSHVAAAAKATQTLSTSTSKENIGGVTATIALCNLTVSCSAKPIDDATNTVASATVTTATLNTDCQVRLNKRK